MDMTEQWKPVPLSGYENHYEVSDLGRVRRSVPPLRGGPSRAGRLLRPSVVAGYAYVDLYVNGQKATARAHRLVALAHLGNPPPQKNQVNHIDGNRLNNAVSNLEWVNQSENNLHATRVLKTAGGEKNGIAKLTENDVLEIRRRAALGEAVISIAKSFGISANNISNIKNRRRWKAVA